MKKINSPRLTVILSLVLILQFATNAFAGITFLTGQGVVLTGADGVVLTGADGVVLTGADGVVLTGADGVVLTGADGVVLTGADGVVLTGADGVVLTGADALTYTRPYGVVLTGADSRGIRSLDPELAMLLNRLPDTSAINVFITFHQIPTQADLNALRAAGILGGTRFHNLPMVMVNATRRQIAAVSTLASVRSIYSNKTLEFLTHDTRVITGQSMVMMDRALTTRNGGLPVSGQGVTVAVLDTGIDATHPDLTYGSKVIQNVRVADLQGTGLLFSYPQVIEGLPNTDLAMGHGTVVAGVIAGTGAAAGGYYGGMAPGARMLGISCGDASLFFVLSGIDYILSQRAANNIRVVNCSFGVSGVFDVHDPVNVATRIMHDAGISVVFSAGNRGSQPNSLNPYSVADWVIGVGSGTKSGSLSTFSSRGAAGYGVFHPTLVAPGEAVVSPRATGVNVTATAGLAGVLNSAQNDLEAISPAHLARYTMASGTSFAAPHVAGTIAMMLQANPTLTPNEIKTILQESATPMLGYSRYEVGAGYLNTYMAVRKAAFDIPLEHFRDSLISAALSLTREQIARFSGTVAAGQTYTTSIRLPADTAYASIQLAWVRAANVANNLEVSIRQAAQSLTSNPAIVQLAGQAIQKTGVAINDPAPGDWTVTVRNTSSSLTGRVQSFSGAIEVVRSNYEGLADMSQLTVREQQAIKRALRTGLLADAASDFTWPASRLDVARAVMLGAGARVPQYVPNSPSFVDLPPGAGAVFIESVVNSPRGNLMGTPGTHFNPQGQADRLTVAVALVKALGLEQQAQTAGASNPGISDWNTVPEAARGYVSVAITRGLIDAQGVFRPFAPITRAELAVAAVALQEATR